MIKLIGGDCESVNEGGSLIVPYPAQLEKICAAAVLASVGLTVRLE